MFRKSSNISTFTFFHDIVLVDMRPFLSNYSLGVEKGPANVVEPFQAATYPGLNSSPWIGNMPDSNPGLVECSLVRCYLAITSHCTH
jgi:hypothetical protein